MGDCQANWGRLALETTNSGESIVPVYSSGDISLKRLKLWIFGSDLLMAPCQVSAGFVPYEGARGSTLEHLRTIM